MTFDDYQKAALRTANLGQKNELFHLVLGLVGESGEIAEKIKKWVRDQASDETKIDIDDLTKELGDVLWYAAVLSQYFEVNFNDVAARNIAKLADRQKRGAIKGSGDNR
ncbi:MAG: nucleoside triphosphate pyrophosphohydrolase family protein [Candidatus Saccharimonadales bacterium]